MLMIEAFAGTIAALVLVGVAALVLTVTGGM